MSPLDRARAATEAAERAADVGDLRTAAAYKSAAAAWERLARPGVYWSHEPARQQLKQLKRELAVSTGPFQPPAPPKAPPPAAEPSRHQLVGRGFQAQNLPREKATIEF